MNGNGNGNMNANGNLPTNVQFLNGLANGQLPVGPACAPAVQLVAPTGNGCTSPQEIRKTGPSAGIDPLALLNQKCGKTTFNFTNDDSLSAPARWALTGNCFEHLMPWLCGNDDVVLSTESPFFRSVSNPFVGPDNGNDPRTEAFQCVTNAYPSIASDLTFRAGNADSLDLMSSAVVTEFTVNPWDEFATCHEEIDQDNCSPCISSNGNNPVIHWNIGLVALSAISGLYVDVPAGVRGRFQVCFASRAISVMVACGVVPINCAINY